MRDALEYLPRRDAIPFVKGKVVFSGPPEGLYCVVSGRIAIVRPLPNGTQPVLDVFGPEDLFGAPLLGEEFYSPDVQGIALDKGKVMFWRAGEVEGLIQQVRAAEFGLALLEVFARQNARYQERLVDYAGKTSERITAALCEFSQRFGTVGQDGFIHIPGLRHQLIAEYVGTSREIVTACMNQLRRDGVIRYSRAEIVALAPALLGRKAA